MKSGEAFKAFLREEMRALTKNQLFGSTARMRFSVAGREDELESHLYRFLRNALIHEGKRDPRFEFVPGTQFFLSFNDPQRLVSSHWIHKGLFLAVVEAQENHPECLGKSFWACEPIEIAGWTHWVIEDWRTGRVCGDPGFALRRAVAPSEALAELAGDTDIEIVSRGPADSSESSP